MVNILLAKPGDRFKILDESVVGMLLLAEEVPLVLRCLDPGEVVIHRLRPRRGGGCTVVEHRVIVGERGELSEAPPL